MPGSAPLTRPALAALTALLLSAGSVAAQGDCILDNCAGKRPPVSSSADRGEDRDERTGEGPRGRSRPGDFDFYVLSLSWSPGFCAVGGGDEKGRDQCRRGADLGFVVHGLWPQYAHGFPSDCRGQSNPPRAALATTDGVYPDEGLARYEWRKHGTCSGLNAFEYFAAVRSARDAVKVPHRFKDPHEDQHVAPSAVVRAFLDANPPLSPDALAAVCRDGTLEEVRICLAKDLSTAHACPEVTRATCRAGDLDVPPVR